MFKFLKIINSIKSNFRVINKILFLIDKNNILKQFEISKNFKYLTETQLPISEDFIMIHKFGNDKLLIASRLKGQVFSNGNLENVLNFKFYEYDENSVKGISSQVFSYNPYSVKQEVFDSNQNRVLWSKENSFIKMPLPDIFFETPTKKDLILLDKHTGVPLWHFSLSNIGRWYNEFDKKWQDGEILHFVGVVNGILWVDVARGTVIGINIEDGTLKYCFTAPKEIVGTTTKPYHTTFMSLGFQTNYDAKRNILFGFHYDVYLEIDLNIAEPFLKFYILEEECIKNQAFCPNQDRYCYDDHYFYYLDAFNGKIGVINRETKVLVWVYSFPDNSTTGILMKIEVSENHIFVLDSGGTLHIFEKENE